MNQPLTDTILTKTGIKLIQGLPTNLTKALSIKQLSEKTGITALTTYRTMSVLSEWSNVISFKVPSTHTPITFYYIKSKNFTINITNNGVRVNLHK